MANLTALDDLVTDVMRYTAVPTDEVGFRHDSKGEWVRYEDVAPELARLRREVATEYCRGRDHEARARADATKPIEPFRSSKERSIELAAFLESEWFKEDARFAEAAALLRGLPDETTGDEVSRLRRALDQLRAPEFDDQSARFNRITKILYLPHSPEKSVAEPDPHNPAETLVHGNTP